METSIRASTLDAFREKVASADPVPAGVAISAVTASLALALVAKVLEISRRRGVQVDALLEKTRRESNLLAELADADIRAFNRYLDSKGAAMQEAIRVPMDAARATVRGIDLCREASGICSTGLVAADLNTAESLLAGAARAILASVESNLRQLPENDSSRKEFAVQVEGLRNQLY